MSVTNGTLVRAASGRIYLTQQVSWATAHDASAGADKDDLPCVNAARVDATHWHVQRTFLLFDTSGIPDTDVISGAKLYLWTLQAGATQNPDTCSIDVVSNNQALESALATDDFDQLGTTVGGTMALADMVNTDTWYSIDLNATGLSWISKTGITKLGVRISPDTTDTAPTGNNAMAWGMESGYPGKDAYLEVTHAPAATGSAGYRNLLGVGI
jgi:hypothetical protein